MSIFNWIVVGVGGPLLVVFLIFAFRQGETVRPSGKPEDDFFEAKKLNDLSHNP